MAKPRDRSGEKNEGKKDVFQPIEFQLQREALGQQPEGKY